MRSAEIEGFRTSFIRSVNIFPASAATTVSSLVSIIFLSLRLSLKSLSDAIQCIIKNEHT